MVEHERLQNSMRIEQQQKAFYYYSNNTYEIEQYLIKRLEESFDPLDVMEFQKDYINITTKIIDQTAVVYRESAERNLINDKEESEANTKLLNDVTEKYLKQLPDDINTVDKTAHRYAKLNNVSFTRVKYANRKLIYDVYPAWLFDVVWDEENPYKMIQLSYSRYYNEDGNRKLYKVFWTETEHWREESVSIKKDDEERTALTGKKLVVPGMNGLENPFGIPYAVCRIKKTGDFWGDGANDIVKANENINFMLTDLMNGNILQTWGTLFMVNTGYGLKAGKSIEGETNSGKAIRIGRTHPITVENARAEQVQPSVEVIKATPNTIEYKETIDWRIKLIAVSWGLNPNSFLQEAKATSGYSKIVDSLEQLELRRDDIQPCLEYEKERFNISRRIINYYNGNTIKGSDSKLRVDEGLEIMVDFVEQKFPETTEERIKDRDWKLKNNIVSKVDLIREDNPDLTIEQAEARLEENRQINEKYKTEIIPNNNNENE